MNNQTTAQNGILSTICKAIAIVLMTVGSCAVADDAAPHDQPNIIFLLADDQGWGQGLRTKRR